MPVPGILTGGARLFRRTNQATNAVSNQGVFARAPDSMGATPKYAFNRRPRDPEYRDTMSRLFVELPADKAAVESFYLSVPEEVRPLAKVLAAGGENAGAGGTGFLDFLLTNTNENFRERVQLVNTLTDNYVVFYGGQDAPVFTYAGTVLNSYQDDQRVWLLRLYQEILRGSKLANRGLVANLRYDSLLVSGYLESLDLALSGETDKTAGSFSFRFRVKKLTIHTARLGSPTIVDTPAAGGKLIGVNAQLPGAASRNGTSVQHTTPEARKPAADNSNAESDAREREFKAYNVRSETVREITLLENPENTASPSNVRGPISPELIAEAEQAILMSVPPRAGGQPANPAADNANASASISSKEPTEFRWRSFEEVGL